MEQILYILLGCTMTSICMAFWYLCVLTAEWMPMVVKVLLSISFLCLALMSWSPLFIK